MTVMPTVPNSHFLPLSLAVSEMNRASAVRAARTAVTGAQNAGRMDSYHAAEKMGIKLKKEWLATLDARTRHSHAVVDGEVKDVDAKFSNGCRFPGDPQGKPVEIYNCRCTLIAAMDGVDTSDAQRWAGDPETGRGVVVENMTYAEWARWKTSPQSAIIKINTKPAAPAIYRKFSDGKEVSDFFDYDSEERGIKAKKSSLHRRWLDNLSADERDAISWYTTYGYGDINDYWCRRNGWESIPANIVEEASRQIDAAISKFPLKENILVQRGVDDFYGGSLIESREWSDIHEIVGMTYHDLGYTSTTALIGNGVATTKPYLFEIEVPAGTGRGAYVNKLAGINEDREYEFLIARGSRFEITGVEINAEPIPPQTVIRMRLITDE